MKLTPRDKKIAAVIVPLILLAAFWFLVLSPKQEEARKAGEDLAQAEVARDEAEAKVARARTAKGSFASDYAEVVRLGKAVPQTVDTPSLLVQLDAASRGTHLRFDSIAAGQRSGSSGSSPSQGASSSSSGGASSGTPPPASGGGSATPASGGGASSASAEGLESVPLTFKFVGDYFDLASFFHKTKRFVFVDGRKVVQVQGRLVTFDSVKIAGEEAGPGRLTAEIGATVWLSPAKEGVTGGATPDGPGAAPSAGAASPSSSSSSTSPTAAVNP